MRRMPHVAQRPWTRTWRGGLLVIALGFLLLFPGVRSLPPIDRDEARFAEATRHMVATDNTQALVVPMVGGELRLAKPPLIYWLQLLSVKATSGLPAVDSYWPTGGIWVYRLPSVVGAVAAMWLTWLLSRWMFAGHTPLLAAVLLGTCTVVMVDARQARADEVLLAFATLTQLALFRLWYGWDTRPGRAWQLALWLGIAGGIMTKGPVVPGVAALTALTLCVVTGRWRWLGRLGLIFGPLLVVVLTAPWFIAVVRQVGWETYWQRAIVEELLQRGASAREGHGGFPGYYLVLLPVTFWPASLALAPAMMRGWGRAFRRRSPGERGWRRWRVGRSPELFCLAWLVPTWLLLELAGTKLPHYLLPCYPALALLAARAITGGPRNWQAVWNSIAGRLAVWGWLVLTGVVALAMVGGLAYVVRPELPVVLWVVVGAVLALTVAGLAWLAWLFLQQRMARAMVVTVAVAAVCQLTALAIILPRATRLWLSSQVYAELRRIDPAGERPIAAAGYHEESLLFLTEGRTERLMRADLRPWLQAHPAGLVVWSDIPIIDIRQQPIEILATVEGLNIGNAQPERLLVFEQKAE